MLKIRLSRQGVKKKPCYKIIVANSKKARDGRFIEKIGFYQPFNIQNNISINTKRIQYWISHGAILSKKVKFLLKLK
ncbi:30S ribosomal protein S16 [Enterobacteriaceae endosymbiont of Macroplea mutica]|uniref:30S ribosomal protein S16 n=1 Tax=Enterobacteriaceae endosymbiont of Macroplea mutica TaxID=2675791 RepID=UPI00144958F8|nr:30S ribosomal protein S16 [Enterobacteriaceae endosymbiont of Macroplea mutica]QJC31406.1 30S ribosomal protein S16 [Enterobacteriaceae endosymbiont of Macroplea mutica]